MYILHKGFQQIYLDLLRVVKNDIDYTVESEIFSRKACKLYIRIESAYLVTMNSPTKIDKNQP